MSLASRLITALLGLALIWYFWPFGGSDEVVTAVAPPPTATDKRLVTKPTEPTSKPKAPTETSAIPGAPKPQLLAREKVEAERQADLKTKAEEVPKPKLKPKRFYRVVVRDGGTLQAGDVVITLGGIATRAADAKCKDAKGKNWACGAAARVALMRLIRGRAVSCGVPVSGSQKSLTARCSVVDIDLGTWMVEQGWAEPAAPAEPKLAGAANAARKKKIGLWR
jgi:endonuclease YncB( thermonuclease family)